MSQSISIPDGFVDAWGTRADDGEEFDVCITVPGEVQAEGHEASDEYIKQQIRHELGDAVYNMGYTQTW